MGKTTDMARAYGDSGCHRNVLTRSASRNNGGAFNTATIMVVDDDEMVLDMLSEMLAVLNYKVVPADSGEKALNIYRQGVETIDLVLLDIMMPGLTGDEVFDRLKELNPNVKVICASGYCNYKTVHKLVSNGCCGFFPKPFDLAALSRHLKKVLDQ